MREKSTLILAVALFVIASSVWADEKMALDQTALSSTTLSGYVDDAVLYTPNDSSDSTILTGGSPFDSSTFSGSFSASPIPEPSAVGPFSIGVLALIIFARLNRHSTQSVR